MSGARGPGGPVRVVTGARLHFGLFAPHAGADRAYGGCGMMVDEPRTEIVVTATDEKSDMVDAPSDDVRTAIEQTRDRCRRHLGIESRLSIRVEEIAPRHAGFGSGTQLALAVAAGIGRLNGEASPDLVGPTGRGRRSAIGVHGFARGGFLVDSGRSREDALGGLDARLEVPADWRVVLATPLEDAGRSGREEREAFERLPTSANDFADRMRRRVDETLVPALRAGDFATFAEAIREHGRDAGRSFAEVQGGLFSTPETARLVAWFEERGLVGVGQTSWGPTVFAFTSNESEARDIAGRLSDRGALALEVRVVRPRNEPASVVLADG